MWNWIAVLYVLLLSFHTTEMCHTLLVWIVKEKKVEDVGVCCLCQVYVTENQIDSDRPWVRTGFP